MKTVAITGANGLVGSACARLLESRGRTVVRLQRHGGTRPFRLGEPVDRDAFRGVDELVHCAYDFTDHRLNVRGSSLLFDAAHAAGVRRLVFISSASAHEGCVSEYGRSKLAVEAHVRGLGGVSLRPGLVFGDPERGIFGALQKISGLPVLPVFSGGHQQLTLVHVDDLAAAVAAVLELEPSPRDPVTVAYPALVEFREILATLARARGHRVRLVSIPAGLALFGLRSLERLGLSVGFRSDSLLGLLHPDPHPDFGPTKNLGVSFRSFAEAFA